MKTNNSMEKLMKGNKFMLRQGTSRLFDTCLLSCFLFCTLKIVSVLSSIGVTDSHKGGGDSLQQNM